MRGIDGFGSQPGDPRSLPNGQKPADAAAGFLSLLEAVSTGDGAGEGEDATARRGDRRPAAALPFARNRLAPPDAAEAMNEQAVGRPDGMGTMDDASDWTTASGAEAGARPGMTEGRAKRLARPSGDAGEFALPPAAIAPIAAGPAFPAEAAQDSALPDPDAGAPPTQSDEFRQARRATSMLERIVADEVAPEGPRLDSPAAGSLEMPTDDGSEGSRAAWPSEPIPARIRVRVSDRATFFAPVLPLPPSDNTVADNAAPPEPTIRLENGKVAAPARGAAVPAEPRRADAATGLLDTGGPAPSSPAQRDPVEPVVPADDRAPLTTALPRPAEEPRPVEAFAAPVDEFPLARRRLDERGPATVGSAPDARPSSDREVQSPAASEASMRIRPVADEAHSAQPPEATDVRPDDGSAAEAVRPSRDAGPTGVAAILPVWPASETGAATAAAVDGPVATAIRVPSRPEPKRQLEPARPDARLQEHPKEPDTSAAEIARVVDRAPSDGSSDGEAFLPPAPGAVSGRAAEAPAEGIAAPVPFAPAARIAAAVIADLAAEQPVLTPRPSTGDLAGPVRHLTVALEPADLGVVTVKMRLVGRTLSLHVNAEREATARLLSDHQQALTDSLQAAGYEPELGGIDGVASPAAVAGSGGSGPQTITSDASATGRTDTASGSVASDQRRDGDGRRGEPNPRGSAPQSNREQSNETTRPDRGAGGLYV